MRRVAAKEMTMVITLQPDLEAALTELASRKGVAPEVLAQRLAGAVPGQCRDVPAARQWERRLLGLAKDCGVSLPNSAFRRETLYE